MYSIEYNDKFVRDLKKITKGGNEYLVDKIIELEEGLKRDPHKKRAKVDIKLISNKEEGIYRLRIGNYRFIYEVNEENKMISFTMAFHRSKSY